jgi:hypothetical protein
MQLKKLLFFFGGGGAGGEALLLFIVFNSTAIPKWKQNQIILELKSSFLGG